MRRVVGEGVINFGDFKKESTAARHIKQAQPTVIRHKEIDRRKASGASMTGLPSGQVGTRNIFWLSLAHAQARDDLHVRRWGPCFFGSPFALTVTGAHRSHSITSSSSPARRGVTPSAEKSACRHDTPPGAPRSRGAPQSSCTSRSG